MYDGTGEGILRSLNKMSVRNSNCNEFGETKWNLEMEWDGSETRKTFWMNLEEIWTNFKRTCEFHVLT